MTFTAGFEKYDFDSSQFRYSNANKLRKSQESIPDQRIVSLPECLNPRRQNPGLKWKVYSP